MTEKTVSPIEDILSDLRISDFDDSLTTGNILRDMYIYLLREQPRSLDTLVKEFDQCFGKLCDILGNHRKNQIALAMGRLTYKAAVIWIGRQMPGYAKKIRDLAP